MREAETIAGSDRERRERVPLDAVVTHHTDGFRSGVARFNELLAEHLGVPVLSLDEPLGEIVCPLLSFKVSELAGHEIEALTERVSQALRVWEVYLHEYAGSPLEEQIVRGAQRVHAGNLEIQEAVGHLNEHVDLLWTPGLVLDHRLFRPSEISVFSFGMAHKIRTDVFRRLKQLLEDSGKSYTVYVSAANHETASLRDSEAVFREMYDVFPEGLYFLGNLSDVAVYNWIEQTTFFAAFFPHGVRGNNTSVAAALEHGAVVITNLDEYSPTEFRHNDNVLDIERCDALPTDRLALTKLSVRAMETAAARDWPALVERLR